MNGRSAGSDGAPAPRRCIAGATRHARNRARAAPEAAGGVPDLRPAGPGRCDQPGPAEGLVRAPNNLPSSTTSNAPAIAAA